MAAAVPAVGLGAFYFGYEKTLGDPVRVGVLGVGDEGNVLLGAINPDYVDVKAIADVRPFNQHRAFHGDVSSPAALKARAGLMAKYGWKTEQEAKKHVKVYTDYRDLIKNAKALGIEAVIIGLPLHLHAPAAIAAMNAGLHVLTEKLMAHSVMQCKLMSWVAEDTHKHLATGHQRHYNILYQEAVESIKRGVLGDIHYIRAQWHRGNKPGGDSWQMPMPKDVKPDDPQSSRLEKELANLKKELDSATGREIENVYKQWAQKKAQLEDTLLARGGVTSTGVEVKPASTYGYLDETLFNVYNRPAAEELLRWRLFERTGGGLMVELGSHQLDAASIFLTAQQQQKVPDFTGKVHPLSVLVSANRNVFGADREVADHVTAVIEFPSWDYDKNSVVGRKRKICVQYSTINGNGFGGYGEIVCGTEGTLVLATESESQILKSGGATSIKADAGTAALDTQASGPAQTAVASNAKADVSRGYQEEIEHWAWCIRVNPKNKDHKLQPRCYPKVAMTDAIIALVTNKAAKKGGKMNFEENWFDLAKPDLPPGDPTFETGIKEINKELGQEVLSASVVRKS
ncbi:MAG: Gfo/Idh/MocA family oxidoreductase [Planctomycetaceae bacterium]|nr:Gfo/Idh/MocA family oxidoreductase [Planctomycetaceae bacterium]